MKSLTEVILTISLLFFYFPISYSQAPDTLWTKVYGGSSAEYAYSIQQTSDGGYIIVGRTASFGAGSVDAWLVRTDGFGEILWTNTFGGSGEDWGRSVQQTSDGGYIITGKTGTFGLGYYDAWLIKTDPLGDSLWTKLFGGVGNDYGNYVQQSLVIPGDEGFIVGGETTSSGAGLIAAWLIKTDLMGDTTWIKTYGGSGNDYVYCVEQTSDGGYISTGWTTSYSPNGDIYLIRTNASGDSLWTKTYGGSESDEGLSVKQTTDGGYIIAGWTRSFGGGSNDVYLIKTDNNGDTLWTKTYGGVYNEEGHSVLQTSDGGYIIAGFIQTAPANIDVWLLRTDASGNILWTKTIGGSGEDRAHSLQQTSDGGYILAGWTNSFGSGLADIWVIKIAPEPSNVSQDYQDQTPRFYVLNQNYPNPFNPTTTIKYQIPKLSFVTLKVFNLLGEEIATLVKEEKTLGSYEVEFDATGLPSDVYFYKLQAGSFVKTKKMVLMK